MNEPPAPFLDPDALLENGAWIRELAQRLVADSSRADDVAQDAWLCAATRTLDAPRRPRSWLFTVVRNLVARSYRADARRAARERSVARPERVDSSAEAILERAELQRQVTSVVLELREPYRSTVLLRYFEGLTPESIARREGVAPATVRSRLGRALGELRTRLDREHRAWTILASPLLGSPTTTAGSGSVGFATAGAIAMSEKTFWAVAGCALLGTAVGWGVHTALSPADVSGRLNTALAAAKALEAEVERLRDELDETSDRAGRLKDENEALLARVEDLTRRSVETQAPSVPASSAAAVGATDTLDWKSLAQLVRANAELLRKRQDTLSSAEEAALASLRGRILALGAAAKSEYERPLLVPGFLSDFAEAILGSGLGLDDEQRELLRELTEEIESNLPAPDAELSPTERYAMRRDLVDSLHEELETLLDEEQLEAWPQLQEYSRGLLRYGDQMRIGIDTPPENFVRLWASNTLRAGETAIDFDSLAPSVERFYEDVRSVLDQHGATDPERYDNLTPESRRQLRNELLRLQGTFDREALPLVPEDIRARYLDRPPMILEFRPGTSVGVTVRGTVF